MLSELAPMSCLAEASRVDRIRSADNITRAVLESVLGGNGGPEPDSVRGGRGGFSVDIRLAGVAVVYVVLEYGGGAERVDGEGDAVRGVTEGLGERERLGKANVDGANCADLPLPFLEAAPMARAIIPSMREIVLELTLTAAPLNA